MNERRILVIGSQCKVFDELKFLPKVAEDLYQVMTDPLLGQCESAIEGSGLLIDPTIAEVKDKIKSAYERAAKDEATLFISYIGHGMNVGEDYFLLPLDAKENPGHETGVHLTDLIKDVHRTTRGKVDGLGVLVDACFSGLAGFGAAEAWVRELKGMLRFEMLTAAPADLTAANGCFSLNLVNLLRDGLSLVPSEHLLCLHLRPLIEQLCPNQVPQHPSYNPDNTLWLSQNAGYIPEPWAKTPVATEIERLTFAYQPTPALGVCRTLNDY